MDNNSKNHIAKCIVCDTRFAPVGVDNEKCPTCHSEDWHFLSITEKSTYVCPNIVTLNAEINIQIGEHVRTEDGIATIMKIIKDAVKEFDVKVEIKERSISHIPF